MGGREGAKRYNGYGVLPFRSAHDGKWLCTVMRGLNLLLTRLVRPSVRCRKRW
jgi:hypothetical protein